MRVPRPTLVRGLVRTVGVNRKSARLARRRVTLATLDIVSYPYSTRSIERTDPRRTPLPSPFVRLVTRVTFELPLAPDGPGERQHSRRARLWPQRHAGSGGLHVGATSPPRSWTRARRSSRDTSRTSRRTFARTDPTACAPTTGSNPHAFVSRFRERGGRTRRPQRLRDGRRRSLEQILGESRRRVRGHLRRHRGAAQRADARQRRREEEREEGAGLGGAGRLGWRARRRAEHHGHATAGHLPPGSESARNCRDTSASTMRKSDRRVNGTMSEG